MRHTTARPVETHDAEKDRGKIRRGGRKGAYQYSASEDGGLPVYARKILDIKRGNECRLRRGYITHESRRTSHVTFIVVKLSSLSLVVFPPV